MTGRVTYVNERTGQEISWPDDEQEFQAWWAEVCAAGGFTADQPFPTVQEIADAAARVAARQRAN